MILGHKSPETGIGGVMTIITHHPVIVHLECIFVCFLSVDVNLSIFHFQVIALVCMDGTFINRQIIQCQSDCLTLLRNPQRTIIIGSPTGQFIQRIQASRIITRNILDTGHYILTCQ